MKSQQLARESRRHIKVGVACSAAALPLGFLTRVAFDAGSIPGAVAMVMMILGFWSFASLRFEEAMRLRSLARREQAFEWKYKHDPRRRTMR